MSNERNIPIKFFFDEEEMNLINSKMKEEGYSDISAFIREQSLNGISNKGDTSGCNTCIKELNAISEDLNKIHEIAASQNSPYLNDLENMQNELNEAILKMNGIRNGNH